MAKVFTEILRFQYNNPPGWEEKVLKQLWTIYYWPSGKQLLEKITVKATGSVFDTKLDFRFLTDQCVFRDDNCIYYDPDYFRKRPYFEPTQQTVLDSDKTYVYLFHELIHFWHKLEGEFKSGFDEEIRATGLYQKGDEVLSENKLRFEASLPRRPCYSWQLHGGDQSFYIREKEERRLLGFPEQSTLTASSKECKFQ